MMINETIILLTYYYDQEDCSHRLLKDIIKSHCGIYLPFNLYLYEPLQKIFLKVVLYDYLERMAEIGFKAVNEEIINLVGKKHPKYVLWTSWQYDVQESTLKQLRKEGTIVVGWFFDDEVRFNNYSKWWIPYLDYCVTNAIEAVPRYRALGARVIQTIPNTGIAVNRNWSNRKEKYDVSFVGSRSCADRAQYINELKKSNIPIHLFGDEWGGYVSFEEMIDIFGSSKVNLNFSRSYDWQKMQIKGRIFQVCMAGGFLLTEYAPAIENYFEIGKEIVCFENTEEMIGKINYYLSHKAERRAIAQAGWKRATCEYTSFHMVSRVFREIEENLAAKDRKINPSFPKLEMPLWIRRIPAQYHFEWGRTLLEENHKGLWKDALALSVSHDPFNIRVWFYYIIGFLPCFMRSPLFRLYRYVEKLYEMLRRSEFAPILYVSKIKQSFIRGLLHP